MVKLLTNIEGSRFGNHLYFYLFASKCDDIFIERIPDMEYWNYYFPALEKLVYQEEKKDNISQISPNNTFFQNYGVDFLESDLTAFIKKYLEKDLKKLIKEQPLAFDLVINLRRGDFYDKDHRFFYGFDQLQYLQDCLGLLEIDSTSRVAVVSDDINWCRTNVTFLSEIFSNVEFLETSPIEAFVECIKAKNLVITNSTFSYWAAYLNTYLTPEHSIFAPNFNTKKICRGKQIAASDNWRLIHIRPYKSIVFEIKTLYKKFFMKLKSLVKRSFFK
ncbi:TPA: alpha-1,2-fucosyltransferase [Streptococcus suis]|nr:alpha-1,2-fucosyltransferase [Streptococcus suis]HEM6082884.1 alpha-1,2-fucosyltransferase [Streptococcus suis]HEM6220443.1 alpha-1,2-fucosyltransferase [Streptococcus suis]HEM6303061.1 alpha-1,2-fucosyltransferase [Streptococcus suis]